MSNTYIPQKIKTLVQERANFHCEYCLSPCEIGNTSCAIEHIIPISKDGSNDLENLALACHGCNWFKSNKIEGVDPSSGLICEIFNPRQDLWFMHFSWSSDCLEIIPLTQIGRATESMLKLNRNGLINLRKILMLAGMHPPAF